MSRDIIKRKLAKEVPSDGFTIVELLMAAAVFSLVLLVAIIGFVQVGKMFYKSIEIGKTNDISGNILGSVTDDLRSFSPGDQLPSINAMTGASVPAGIGNNAGYTCIGSHRYTFFLSQYPIPNPTTSIVNLNNGVTTSTKVGLVRDNVAPGSCNSPAAAPCSWGNFCWGANAQQLLGDGMSLGKFYITPSGGASSNLYAVKVVIGFGDNINPKGVFNFAGAESDSGPGVAANTMRCTGKLGTNFCSVSSIDTFVNLGNAVQ